jgi:hypothetical protein
VRAKLEVEPVVGPLVQEIDVVVGDQRSPTIAASLRRVKTPSQIFVLSRRAHLFARYGETCP